MKSQKNIEDTKTVHVFGLPGITKCTKEENSQFFRNEFDYSFLCHNYNQKKQVTYTYDYVLNNLEPILEHLKRNKDIYIKIAKCVSIALFIASNPINTFALMNDPSVFYEITEKLGTDIFSGVSTGTIKGVTIITALRLFTEYTRGGSKYKTFEIIKQCVIVLLVIIILPALPGMVSIFVNRYLPY